MTRLDNSFHSGPVQSGPMTPSGHAAHVLAVAASPALGRSVTATSWRRSLHLHGLDPCAHRRNGRLTAAGLQARREQAGALVGIAGPVLDRLARAVSGAGCAVILADSAGVVLDARTRGGEHGFFQAADLAPGAEWSEAAEGTNAIGTALADQCPVVIWRDQHFLSRNAGLSCIAAPVFGPDGAMVAALDVSSCRGDLARSYARLFVHAVQDAACHIEWELFRTAFPAARMVAVDAGEARPPMLLAVDRDDLLLGANRAARRHFGLSEADIAARPAARDILAEPEGGGLDAAQRSEMLRALARHGGNVSAAARELGIGRATFYRKKAAFGLS